MSSSTRDERQRIRERKKRELHERVGESDGTTPGAPIEVEDGDHLDAIVERHDVVLVDCYADWCGPCQLLEPAIEAIAADRDVAVAKVDVDRHAHLAQRFGARGVPTLVIIADGEQQDRMVGVQDRATLENAIDRFE